MKIIKMKDMKGGWFVGNFEPTTFKTDQFEAAVHTYKKGEIKEAHIHKEITEINYLLSGKFLLKNYDGNGSTLEINEGDIFIIHPFDIADPEFLEDCIMFIIKTPSIPGDKYLI